METLHGEDHIIKGVSVHVSDAVPKNDGFGGGQGRSNKFRRNDGGGGGGPYNEGPGGNWDGLDNWNGPNMNNWHGGGAAGGGGGNNAMDWSKMGGGMGSLAMPMLAALSQASMEILGSMQHGPPNDGHGPGKSSGGNWKQGNWENQGGRGDRYNR